MWTVLSLQPYPQIMLRSIEGLGPRRLPSLDPFLQKTYFCWTTIFSFTVLMKSLVLHRCSTSESNCTINCCGGRSCPRKSVHNGAITVFVHRTLVSSVSCLFSRLESDCRGSTNVSLHGWLPCHHWAIKRNACLSCTVSSVAALELYGTGLLD